MQFQRIQYNRDTKHTSGKRCVMKKLLCIIIVSLMILASSTYVANAKSVLISYEKPQDALLIEQKLANTSYELLQATQLITANITAEKRVQLEQLPIHLTIEDDQPMNILQEPSTSLWNIQKLAVPTAWSGNFTGKGVKIAVIDTGINEIPALANVKKRVSFVKDDPTTPINEADNIDRGYNDQGHGTLVASIIGSQANIQIPVQGIAPNAELYALKYADGTQGGVASTIVKAINWSIENNMDIINISSGLKTDVSALHKAIKQAVSKGILIVASAGNDGQSEKSRFPARYTEVISVGSINKYGDISSFSNNLKGINFVAPGEEILAFNQLGKVKAVNGTSFSAPHITALLALYKERFPYSSSEMLLQYLKKSANEAQIPRFSAPAFKELSSSVKVEKKTVKDHQIELKINYSALKAQEQAVILVDRKIIAYTTASSYRLTKLTSNKKHKIEVLLLNAIGNWSASSSVTIKTLKDITAPSAPNNFSATVRADGIVQLIWKQKKTADFSKTIIYENGVKVATTTTTSYVKNAPLKLKKHYQYKIISVDTSGNRSKAKELSITRYK